MVHKFFSRCYVREETLDFGEDFMGILSYEIANIYFQKKRAVARSATVTMHRSVDRQLRISHYKVKNEFFPLELAISILQREHKSETVHSITTH